MPVPAPAPRVQDPVLGSLVSLLSANEFGVYSAESFEQVLRQTGRESNVPLDVLRDISRAPSRPGEGRAPAAAALQIRFTGERHISVPYSILGYHPGKLRTSGSVRFLEWHMGDITIRPESGSAIQLDNVFLWGLERGTLDMDIDGWLDAVLGSKLDDTIIVGLALFEHRGEPIAMALGYNKKGKGTSGAFSLTKDKILFPHPRDYKISGAYLRGRLEQLLPQIRARIES